jgi:hypothetical protein
MTFGEVGSPKKFAENLNDTPEDLLRRRLFPLGEKMLPSLLSAPSVFTRSIKVK